MGKKTMLEALLAEQARKVRPRAAPRRSADPLPRFRCAACGEVSVGLKAADRHADEQAHRRYAWEMPV